jgi:hypothetical protein
LVRLGYANEALLEVRKQSSVALAVDKDGNNAFHICVAREDEAMCLSLLRTLPVRVCSKLLQSKNRVRELLVSWGELLRRKASCCAAPKYSKC